MTNLQDAAVFKRILQRNVSLPLAICALLCAIFVGLVYNLISVSKWVDHTNEVINRSSETLKSILDTETAFRGYLLTGNEEFLNPYKAAVAKIESELSELSDLVNDNPNQVLQVRVMTNQYLLWKAYLAEATANRDETIKLALKGHDLNKSIMDRIRSEFKKFSDTEHRLREERTQDTKDQTQLMLMLSVGFCIISGTFLAFSGRRQMLQLSDSYEDILKKQQAQNDELSNQAWLRTGQAELGNKIRGELTLNELGNSALEFFSHYVDSTIGALFVIKDQFYLERVASQAYNQDNRAMVKDKYHFGEGLIGDVAQKQKLVHLTNLPEDYIKVTSSLGNMNPREIVIVPLKAEGTIQAVIELAFMREATATELKFLEHISETMGIAIKSALYRMRLQDLLEETQVQAEELQSQQEELRVSNEELTERSNSLIQAQVRLENQHAELEQTNLELEEQKQILDVQNRDLKEAQMEVETKSKNLEEANRYKSEFLANMSHELRTPLNSTLILSKLLKDNQKGNLNDEQVMYADTIYSAGNDLLSLINDILDLSKVEAGKLDIFIEKFPVERLVAGIEQTFTPIFNDKKIKFVSKIDPKAKVDIHSDRLRLEQILKNLISNAAKFTSKGSVTLEVNLVNKNQVSFSVIDTGIGIPSEQLEIIFEAFRQADGTTNRKYGGTGLGLTISRNLSSLLSGHIEVESEVGKGSKFTLILPLTIDSKAEPFQMTKPPALPVEVASDIPNISHTVLDDDLKSLPSPGSKVLLIIEDDLAFARILLSMAREEHFLCLIAHTTSRGFELAMEHKPDAIILDMKLPDALGLSLLDKLKENPRTRHIPVHAISAMDYSREALHLGAVGYLQKPSKVEDIKKSLQTLESKIDQRMKKVLVIEDDSVQRMAIEKLIGGDGVEIVSIGTGNEAMEHLSKTQFDCVILDLSLPDISGFDLLEKFSSSNKNMTYPPVIVYTGRVLSHEEEGKLRRYSETIIIKGARSPERLLSEVTLFLHQVESHMSEEKQKILKVTRTLEKAFEEKTVLLVDDDVRNIFALMSMLESKGANVIVARNGVESLEKLQENDNVDLVLMDIMMPEMDGYTAMREIRKNPAHQKLPIIAVTAKAMKDDYEKCIEAGANDYLAKPVDVEKLISLMRVWLPRH